MPPKKAPAKKLHELAAEVRVGHKINDISKKTFIVGKQFATGGFGRIHTCTEEGKSQQMVMKIEPSTNGPLLTEVVVFNRILKKELIESYKKKKKISWIGLPYLIANGYFTYESEKMRYMIIPKYATSLEAVRETNGGTLAMKDSLTVASCILDALEYLHESDYAHADVKAANILLEKQGVYSTAVLVDFGLAHRTTNNVDKPDKKRAHNGTCIFTSTDAHRGNNPSFRGDIEILAYNLMMWATGTLPWMALESSPEKVFDAKQKFIAGLPGTLQNVLKNESSAVVGCIASMFDISMKTNYTDKVDMGKLKKLVTDAIQKTSSDGKKTPTRQKKLAEEDKNAVTPKRSTRRLAVKEESDNKDNDEVEVKPEKKATPRKRTTRKAVEVNNDSDDNEEQYENPKSKSSRTQTKSKRAKEEDIDDEEEIIIPKSSRSRSKVQLSGEGSDVTTPSSAASTSRSRSIRLGLTSSTASSNKVAKKIEQKYKRLSMNKSSLVPVTISVASDKSPTTSTPSSSSGLRSKRKSSEDVGEGITLKTQVLITPAIKKAKTKSGISSATKASPTELRRVPGVRNFPKGRRSMIIKETSAKYKERLASRQTKPTFDDSSCSSEV